MIVCFKHTIFLFEIMNFNFSQNQEATTQEIEDDPRWNVFNSSCRQIKSYLNKKNWQTIFLFFEKDPWAEKCFLHFSGLPTHFSSFKLLLVKIVVLEISQTTSFSGLSFFSDKLRRDPFWVVQNKMNLALSR